MRDTADNLALRVRQVLGESTIAGTAWDYARQIRHWSWGRRLEALVRAGTFAWIAIALPLGACISLGSAFGPQTLLALLSGTATACACLFAGYLTRALHRSRLLGIGATLPIADRDLVVCTWLGIAARSALALPIVVVAFVAVAVAAKTGVAGFALAVVLALAQWALCIALGTFLAAWGPRVPWMLTAFAGFVLVAACLISKTHGFGLAEHGIFLFTPAGWLSLTFGYAAGSLPPGLPVVLLALVLGVGVRSCRRLVGTYRVREIHLRHDSAASATTSLDDAPQDGLDARLLGILSGKIDELSLDDVEAVPTETAIARIRSRDFLRDRPVDGQTFAARGQRHWLSPRENCLFGFLTNDGEDWPGTWSGTLLAAVVAIVADVAVGWLGFRHVGYVADTTLFVSGTLVVIVVAVCLHSMLAGPWLGMLAESTGRPLPPRFALLSITFDEISVVMFKVTLTRLALMLPALVLAHGLLAHILFRKSPETMAIAMSIVSGVTASAIILAIIGQGYLITWRLYRAIRVHWRTARSGVWLLALTAASPGGTFCAAGVIIGTWGWVIVKYFGFPLNPNLGAGFEIGWGLVWLFLYSAWSVAVWFIVREGYHRGLFDLLTTISSGGGRSSSAAERTESKSRRRRALRRRYGWLWWLRKPRGAAA